MEKDQRSEPIPASRQRCDPGERAQLPKIGGPCLSPRRRVLFSVEEGMGWAGWADRDRREQNKGEDGGEPRAEGGGGRWVPPPPRHCEEKALFFFFK